MGHEHDHSHAVSRDADRGKLAIALAIIASFMVLEVVVGLIANSLALLSDAAHMLTDAASLALALFASRLAARPAAGQFTFGYKRAEILSAQLNGVSLLVLAAILGYEAIGRLAEPPEVRGGFVIAVGVAGAVANVAAAAVLARAERRSLNVEGAMQHVLADLYASFAAIAAGVAVVAASFDLADPLAALVVVALMLRSGWRLVRDSSRVLLEASPRGIDVDEVGRSVAGSPGVEEVHDLHVWEVTTGFPALAAHVLVAPETDCHQTRREIERMLHDRFHLEHTTLQVDHRGDQPLLQISPRPT